MTTGEYLDYIDAGWWMRVREGYSWAQHALLKAVEELERDGHDRRSED
jgi:hypothetical protein